MLYSETCRQAHDVVLTLVVNVAPPDSGGVFHVRHYLTLTRGEPFPLFPTADRAGMFVAPLTKVFVKPFFSLLLLFLYIQREIFPLLLAIKHGTMSSRFEKALSF